MAKDDDQLKLLSIFHYVFSCFSLFSLAMTVVQWRMIARVLPRNEFGNSSVSEFSFLTNLIWVFGLFFFCMFAANIASAYFIGKRRNRSFSLVVAGINCLQVPIGTALGIFALVVLLRDTVHSQYLSNRQNSPQPDA